MVAANIGDVPIIQYLIDKGADLAAHDWARKTTALQASNR
jgi:hypothetical protein